MNTFDKVICILLASVLMFLFPLLYLAQKQDAINQVYLEDSTVTFVNDIKNHGYITSNMYERYLKKVNETDNLYKIELVHTHTVVDPKYDETTDTFMDDYYTYDKCTYEDDIMKVIYEDDHPYYMRQGDSISLKIYNRTNTFAGRLMRLVGIDQNTQLLVTYGGIIRDENY